MSNSLFRRKNISSILAEGGDDPHGEHVLHRVLTVKDLTFLVLRPFWVQVVSAALALPYFMAGRALYYYL